jgi:hypothetical protein
VTFDWRWPDEPSWVRVTLDPGDRIEEVCEANNDRCHLTVARPARIRLDVRESRKLQGMMNLVGSFCPLDYAQAQFEILEGLLRDAVYPATSPVGVQDSHYIDGVYEFEREGDAVSKAFEEDGRFFQARHARPRAPASLHEAGHYVLKLSDLHGYDGGDVLLKDGDGQLYAGTGSLPRSELLGPAPAGPYYSSLMHGHHLWLHPANAGKIHYYRGYRLEDRSRGGPWPLLPTRRCVLDIRDVEDGPLANAAVYVYDVTHDISLHVGPWIADRSKFAWVTDEDGQYIFPDVTRPTWDDPRTDEAEGRMRVRHPFEQAQRMRDMTVEKGILLLKIVGARHTELHWLTDKHFQEAFFAGTGPEGRVTVKTSLRSPARPARVYAERIPGALLKRNLQPVASVGGPVSVGLGGTFTLDASASRDPDGQPIEYYRWTFPSGARVHEGAVIADADVLDLGGSFTLSLWVRADSDGEIFTKASRDGSWVRGGKRLFVRGGEICFDAYGVGYLASGRRVTGSGWRHVAVVHEKVARALRLYVDGVQVAERKFGMTVDVPGHCVVMGRGFRGAADELRVYGCALSRTEVERLASGKAPRAGLVGHWSFNEREGAGLADSSGRGVGGMMERAKRVPGRFGGALEFDGADWRFSKSARATLTAPANFDRLEARVCVYDGLRWSEEAKRTIIADLDQEPRRPERLRKAALRAGLRYSYYEGTWSSVRRLARSRPMSTGIAPTISRDPSRREENFALRFAGFIDAPKDGMYVFYTTSDDGSLLYIGEEIVVDNDGLHGPDEKCGAVALGKGLHAIAVHYAQGGGEGLLEVNWEGPGVKKGAIPAEALFHKR